MIDPIEEILIDAKAGKMFILVDDEDRENEGDLIIPAGAVTPAAVNFMATHGRGLVCLAMDRRNGRQARPANYGSVEHVAVSHGLHRIHRGAGRRDDRNFGLRSRPYHIDGHRSGQRAGGCRHPRPCIPHPRTGRRGYGARRAHGSRRRYLPAGGTCARRGIMRDHERRRHDGAVARPYDVRPHT